MNFCWGFIAAVPENSVVKGLLLHWFLGWCVGSWNCTWCSVLMSCSTFGKACSTSQVTAWKVIPFLYFRSGCQMLFVSCSSVSQTAEVWGDHDFTCNLAGESQGSFPLLAVWVQSACSLCPYVCSASRILGKYFCSFPSVSQLCSWTLCMNSSLGWRQDAGERNYWIKGCGEDMNDPRKVKVCVSWVNGSKRKPFFAQCWLKVFWKLLAAEYT